VRRANAAGNLDEIYAGVFDGMTYEEIKRQAPDEFAERAHNKLGYRYRALRCSAVGGSGALTTNAPQKKRAASRTWTALSASSTSSSSLHH